MVQRRQPLWSPSAYRINHARMTRLEHALGCTDYSQLHRYSVENKPAFWRRMWDLCGIVGEPGDVVLRNPHAMPGAAWFPDARLNAAENLLRYRDARPALVSILENGERREITYAELYQRALCFAVWLKEQGIQPGDRVAALMPNVAEAVIAMLGVAAMGATFSSCSPDFGIQGVLDRFGQIRPRVLVCADGYYYNGKTIDVRERVAAISDVVDSIEQVVIVGILNDATELDIDVPVTRFASIQNDTSGFEWARLPFDHPLYIMYSSGTTGIPKCIVHGAGGTLLQQIKEHKLHVDLKRDDVLFYFTTCGWMMWNWLVAGLACGATLVLYDGSPFYPNAESMMDMAERERISVFGTSPKFIAALQKAGVVPRNSHDLAALHTILSTGSPLAHESFRYVYRDVKADVCLSSISGGTDIISCFALGNPTLPVYEGELQCAGLGMDVDIFDDEGNSLVGQKGELVCKSPFPSMPTGFWNDNDGSRYHDAYFARYDNVWAHGDHGEMTAHDGIVIHGRSDAVLNPGGVRIGTAEIYRQVEKIDAVIDAVCVGQAWQDDVRIVLFVVLRQGVVLSDELADDIRQMIRHNTTPRHVPAKILQVNAIPRTLSGKIVELAVRAVIRGERVTNADALANPEALEAFRNRPELAD